jgi:protein-disulfide isomerase
VPRLSRSTIAVAATSALLLAAGATWPVGAADAPAAAAPLDLPRVDLAGLGRSQLEVVRKVVGDEFCYCGCPHTLAGCLRDHAGCKHAPRMAALVVRLARQGMTAPEVLKTVTAYYAGFDRAKRARLDVREFGPPLGDPAAPVTLVEFSDFTCPYCQAVRPALEAFVRANASRVKLLYKPFPIASHPRALEAAVAGEWARDRGLFWKMHDRLFEAPHALADADLAAHARALGGDADDLLRALAEGRRKDRIAASQAEARAGGLQGTPTFFLDGRRLVLPAAPDDLAEVLRFALEDEEEWRRDGRWAADD